MKDVYETLINHNILRAHADGLKDEVRISTNMCGSPGRFEKVMNKRRLALHGYKVRCLRLRTVIPKR